MGKYAENTSVSVENSPGEIERVLQRYGADSFGYAWDRGKAVVQFVHEGRQIRFALPLPDKADRAFTHTPGKGFQRSEADAFKAWEQACRQKWRALALAIKAKLEAVEAGITSFEDEFMSHIVLPDGSSFGDWARPQIAKVYAENTMPGLLQLGAGE